MKNNLLKMLLIGCMITSSVSTGVFASTDITNNIKENKLEQTQENCTLDSELKEYILSLKGINNDEKQKLIESEKRVQPIYKQIDSLIADANKAGESVNTQIEALYNKIDEIKSEDNEIMDKVYKYEDSKLTDGIYDDSYDDDMINYIKSLSILTDAEKNKLIDTQGKLEPYFKQLDSLYTDLEKIQKPIIDQINKLYDKVDIECKDVAYIWDKVDYNN